MTTITQQSVTTLTSILSDPDFVKLSSRARSTSVFELLKIDELNTCSILGWLLDPKEGHAQGEYFVRALISSLATVKDDKELKVAKFLACSFSSFCVLQEVPISSGKTARRIDLLLLDADSKKGICIERKDGTSASNGQLAAYHDWCVRTYPDWEWVFVLSDSHERCHGGEAHPEFIQINDDWLVYALDNLVGRNAVPPEMEQIFRNLKSFVFGEWDEASDSYYKEFNEIIKQATSRHKDVLAELVELEFSNGVVAASISKAEFYTNVLPEISGNLVETLFAKLWFSNLTALDLLFEYSEFELIGESLQDCV
ncbi:PD-(D/E)XK nuclease family protein, partial [Shewanella sp. 0m-11]